MSDDLILVEKINELEERLKLSHEANADLRRQLRQPIRIVKSFQELWMWWWKTEERQILTILPTLALIGGAVAFWLLSGVPTNNFYIDYSHGSAGIYQELNWGKDRKVEICYSDTLGECTAKMIFTKKSWEQYQEMKGD